MGNASSRMDTVHVEPLQNWRSKLAFSYNWQSDCNFSRCCSKNLFTMTNKIAVDVNIFWTILKRDFPVDSMTPNGFWHVSCDRPRTFRSQLFPVGYENFFALGNSGTARGGIWTKFRVLNVTWTHKSWHYPSTRSLSTLSQKTALNLIEIQLQSLIVIKESTFTIWSIFVIIYGVTRSKKRSNLTGISEKQGTCSRT